MTDDMRKMRKELSILDRAEEKLRRGEPVEKALRELNITEEELGALFDRYAAPPNGTESLEQSGLLDAVFPMFFAPDVDTSLEQIGSGVVISIGEELFALTAAHVTDRSHEGVLFMPAEDGITPISGNLSHTTLPEEGDRENDRADIAYYRLSPSWRSSLHASIKPLTIDHLLLTDSVETGHLFTFVGYPWRKTKRRNGSQETDRTTYTGHVLPPDVYDRLGYGRRANLLIRMRRDKTYSARFQSQATAPHPQGISGGGVIAWPMTFQERLEPSGLKLAGIGHTYHATEHCLGATRVISYVMAIIKNNPHLAVEFARCEDVCDEFAQFLHKQLIPEHVSSIPHVIGIGWYRADTYQKCLAIFEDRADLPNTFEEWLVQAERAERQIQSGGIRAIRVEIDPLSFPRWCRENGFSRIDREARMAYGNAKAFELRIQPS